MGKKKEELAMTIDKLIWGFRVQAWADKKNYIIKITGNRSGIEGVKTGTNLAATLLRLIKKLIDEYNSGDAVNKNKAELSAAEKNSSWQTQIGLVPGVKVRFEGKIRYGQDFATYENDFGDQVFTFEKKFDNGLMVFSAPGYGKVGNYGNGSIYVSEKYKDKIKVIGDANV